MVFAVLGEALVDMVQLATRGMYVARPGGGPLNTAVGLRRLGHQTSLLARLSSGRLGAVVRDHADANAVDLSACVETDDPATLAFASLDEHGHATYDFYTQGTADWGWTPAEVGALPGGTRVFHTGSLATALDPGATVVLSLVERLRSRGRCLLSYDPNVRPAGSGPDGLDVGRVERFVAASHVVKASEEDLTWLYPGGEPLDMARRWASSGPSLVVVTRGVLGCFAVAAGGAVLARDGLIVDVVDTIGAGDAFGSGLLSGLVDAGCTEPASLDALSTADIGRALDRAVLVAAMTCERVGADPPTRQDYQVRSAVDAETGSAASSPTGTTVPAVGRRPSPG